MINGQANIKRDSKITMMTSGRNRSDHRQSTDVLNDIYVFFVCFFFSFFFLLFFLSFFLGGPTAPQWARVSSFTKFLDHTQPRSTFGRTPLDEWSARRIDLYLTTHDTYNRKTSMPPVVFEPTISAGERQQTYALDRTATGTGTFKLYRPIL